MEKAKIRPLATLKPCDRSWQNIAGVTMSWTSLGMLNFIAFAHHISDLPYHLGWLVCNAFFRFLQLATAYTPIRIFTKNTSKDVVPVKDVPFGVQMTTINIESLKFPTKRHTGTDSDWTNHSKITKTFAKTFDWWKSYYVEFRCMSEKAINLVYVVSTGVPRGD